MLYNTHPQSKNRIEPILTDAIEIYWCFLKKPDYCQLQTAFLQPQYTGKDTGQIIRKLFVNANSSYTLIVTATESFVIATILKLKILRNFSILVCSQLLSAKLFFFKDCCAVATMLAFL